MADRFQLVLASVALVVGMVPAGVDHWGRRIARPDPVIRALIARSVAAAGLAGALMGGWLSPRCWPWWVAAAAVLLVPDRSERTHPLGPSAPLLCLVSLAGVWLAVPDTEPAVGAAAALLPLALLRHRRGPAPGPAGTTALVVAVLGAVWVGSAGRGAALAAVVAVGMLVVAPAVLGWSAVPAGRDRTALFGAHAAVALVTPRLVMERSVGVAAAVVASVTALLCVLAVLVRRRVADGSAAAGRSPG